MSATRNSLAKKSSHRHSKNLKAPKRNHCHRFRGRSRPRGPILRNIPSNKPPPANGQRLVFLRNGINGTFVDNCSWVPPIGTEMPREGLRPFWQTLETVENYNLDKIHLDRDKRANILKAFFLGFFLVGIILCFISAP